MSRINRRAFLKASGGAATLGVLAGCSGDGGDGGGDGGDGDGGGDGGDGGMTGTPSDGGSTEPITIAALEPISGPFAPWSTVHRDGLLYAVDQINADGGVLGGRELQVEVVDTGADPAQADSSFRRLVEQNDAVASTGSVSSDVGLRVSQTAADLEVPHFLHMSGTDEVITQDTQHVFRVGLLPATRYIQAQADAFADAGYTSVGAVVADYAWGRSTEAAINEFFDVDVQIEVAPVPPDTDFSSYIRQMPDDLEMLIASGHPPGTVSIANTALDLGYEPDVITGSSAPPNLLTGGLNEPVLEPYVHIHNSDPYGQAFADVASGYAEGHDNQFNTHTAYGYVTGQLIAAGIEDAGSADSTAIADAVRNIQLDTIFAEPIQYSEYGELDQTSVIFSRLLTEAPSYYPDGSFSYDEFSRSAPVPAREP
ncbi:MAG TPA: ABC transporter substrate-binding protein [Halobacteriales archaeon]|nr:ABC transporter substrate-binding protein [Halobacteriales archaeon]